MDGGGDSIRTCIARMFKLNWNSIEKESFSTYASELLEESLNSNTKPAIICDKIGIKELNFGTVAPNFQILEIGDLGIDKFRGIFSFKYYGDASITLNTKISANLLKNYSNSIGNGDEFKFIKPKFILSDCDFDIPLNLKLSNFKLSSIIIIVFNKSKGLTLVFKNDPLENIDVNSTFDKISPIANFLQTKIENQITELFKEFLPNLLYKFSLKYTIQSFDQFHKDLLIEEHEDIKRVYLKDLDLENPFKITPGSLMRLTRLASIRQTLSLGNGIDKLTFDKFNKDLISKGIINNYNSMMNLDMNNKNKIEISEDEVIDNDKIEYIKEFQNRVYSKNGGRLKRRVIHMGEKKKVVRGTRRSPQTVTPMLTQTPTPLSTSPPPYSR